MKISMRFAALVFILLMTILNNGCARKKASLSPEEALRKRLGVKSATKWNDGVVNQLQLFDPNGRKVEERWYNPKGFIVTSRKMEYDGNDQTLKQMFWYKSDRIDKSYHKYTYDNNKNRVSDEWFTPLYELQARTTFEYEGDNLIKEIREDGRGNLLYTREYRYDEGNQVEFVERNNRNGISNRQLYYYNEQGQKEKEEWFNPNGEIIVTKEFIYENGLPVLEIQHGKDNSLQHKIMREYDHNGLIYIERWVNPEDEPVFENVYSYEYY